jgi:hypothetical protein
MRRVQRFGGGSCVRRLRAAVGAVVLLITATVLAPLSACDNVHSPTAAATHLVSLPWIDLPSTLREMINAAELPSGFASLGARGPVVHFWEAQFPDSYISYRIKDSRKYVVLDGHGRAVAAFVWADESRQDNLTGYESPAVRETETERILSAFIGSRYSRQVLQNGVLFTSPGRPAVEFVFVHGLKGPRSREQTEISYRMAVIVFVPRAAVIELVTPCDIWWLSTPPPGWTSPVGLACRTQWVQIAKPR